MLRAEIHSEEVTRRRCWNRISLAN